MVPRWKMTDGCISVHAAVRRGTDSTLVTIWSMARTGASAHWLGAFRFSGVSESRPEAGEVEKYFGGIQMDQRENCATRLLQHHIPARCDRNVPPRPPVFEPKSSSKAAPGATATGR